MNKKEAELIAWEICKLKECYDSNIGKRDGCMSIANQSIELINNILKADNKINEQFNNLYKPTISYEN